MTNVLLSRRSGYVAAPLLVAATVGLLRLFPALTGASQALLLLVAVFLVAWIWESGPGILAALLGTLSFNYFFLPPVYTLTVEDPRNVVALLVFLFAALLVGRLSATSRLRARAAEERRIREETTSALLATLAHDLKTPVTSARAAVENLAADAGETEGSRRALEALTRLTRLVDDLLLVVKLEAGAAHPERERVWCGALLDAAVERFGDALAPHALKVEMPPAEWVVNVDPAQVAEALGLGLENAARYSPPGSVVSISVVRDAGGFALRVDDAGAGIPPEDRERVLEKFVRLPSSAGTKGSGLGLYLARTLVEMNGGRIAIGESEAHGTRFEIRLPEAGS